jgi:hypothetical protein
MDRDALSSQMASVRDGAAELLEQLKTTVTNVTGATQPETEPAAPPQRAPRSGGVVDAPGKKHRKPMPSDPRGVAADAKRANRQAGSSGMKTMKRRGRG